jgi:ABC-2 type transport system ATP-binding protein
VSAIVEAANLTKQYDEKCSVDHISFDVNEGEIFGFLGPNGAGKTTTIRMLTTLASISEGECRVAGNDVRKKPNEVRRSIGLVPQDAAVDNDLKGIENLRLTAKLYHIPDVEAKKRAGELLELVGLKDSSGRLVRTYSGGMRKRLELIVGLMHEPKILFLDEPTLGLDIQTRSVMWDYIHRINRENGMTIFLTTHYLEEADSLCNRVAIIDHGKIRVSGTPTELKTRFGSDVLEIEVEQQVSNAQSLVGFFESIDGVKEVRQSGNAYRIKLPRMEQSLQDILGRLSKLGVKVTNMRFEKSNLDQVFLDVTGRSIRDEVNTEPQDSFNAAHAKMESARN